MLNWFPSPYPDELWYSVLCRFYVSSGIKESTLVKDLLFQGMKSAKMGFLYPSSSMRLVLSQLPPQAFNPRKMILKHTTFLYFARMYSLVSFRLTSEQTRSVLRKTSAIFLTPVIRHRFHWNCGATDCSRRSPLQRMESGNRTTTSSHVAF